MRIAAGIEYDGRPYCGWQIQNGVRTVQKEVEKALSKVANHPVQVICAGRTDTGVHAANQVIHFDTTAMRSDYSWVRGANTHLPESICLTWAKPVNDNFHARFMARRRCYRYIILNRSVRPAFLVGKVARQYRPLDVVRMAEAAQHLIGEHDFTSYRAQACQAKSPVRDMQRIDVTRSGEFIYLDICANAFLHHMVRNIAGVLMTIGAGKKPVDWTKEVLEYRDRREAGITAPAAGLYLVSVSYDAEFGLPDSILLPSYG